MLLKQYLQVLRIQPRLFSNFLESFSGLEDSKKGPSRFTEPETYIIRYCCTHTHEHATSHHPAIFDVIPVRKAVRAQQHCMPPPPSPLPRPALNVAKETDEQRPDLTTRPRLRNGTRWPSEIETAIFTGMKKLTWD